jgi:hypothetical protein
MEVGKQTWLSEGPPCTHALLAGTRDSPGSSVITRSALYLWRQWSSYCGNYVFLREACVTYIFAGARRKYLPDTGLSAFTGGGEEVVG